MQFQIYLYFIIQILRINCACINLWLRPILDIVDIVYTMANQSSDIAPNELTYSIITVIIFLCLGFEF